MKTQAKGAVVVATLDYLRTTHGNAAVDEILARLPASRRALVENASATSAIPLDDVYALWEAIDGRLRPDHPEWAEAAGAHSITSKGVQLYSGIVRKATPLDFLTQPVSLFRLFYDSGEMDVVERTGERAVVRLHGFADVNVLFCRRQTGGLRRAVELAGGTGASAQHVRCVAEGDAFCEWELKWRMERAV
jgi:hypothetical protein